MKKSILILSLALIAGNTFAQINHPQVSRPDTAVNFVTPYAFYADALLFKDTAFKLAVRVTETLNSATFSYSILTARNKTIAGGTSSFLCSGACFTLWMNDRTAYNEAVIVTDSALKGLHDIQ